MGQYYFPTILREKNKRFYSEEFYSHQYDRNGLKLMEHSYVGNVFTETVIAQLFNKPGRLAWIGDYHAKGDFAELNSGLPPILEKRFYEHYKCFCCKGDERYKHGKHVRYYNHPDAVSERKGRFILNHDKHCYIDMVEYEKNAPKDDWDCLIHPLPLLTAVGNGRGGGDFVGVNQEDVGIWAGDLIEVADSAPNGYADCTDDVWFEETY